MRVLVACEYSGVVRDAFLARGHDATSCDWLPTESPGPHHHGDVMDLLRDRYKSISQHASNRTFKGIAEAMADQWGGDA